MALVAVFFLFSNTGLAKVNPAQTLEELQEQAGEPGNEDLSVMSNTEGLQGLHIGLEPYLPDLNKAGLSDEEDSIYLRQAESQSGASESSSSSSSQGATER